MLRRFSFSSASSRPPSEAFTASRSFGDNGGKLSYDAGERALQQDLRQQEKQYEVTQCGMRHGVPHHVILRVGSIGINVLDKRLRSIDTLLYQHTRIQVLNNRIYCLTDNGQKEVQFQGAKHTNMKDLGARLFSQAQRFNELSSSAAQRPQHHSSVHTIQPPPPSYDEIDNAELVRQQHAGASGVVGQSIASSAEAVSAADDEPSEAEVADSVATRNYHKLDRDFTSLVHPPGLMLSSVTRPLADISSPPNYEMVMRTPGSCVEQRHSLSVADKHFLYPNYQLLDPVETDRDNAATQISVAAMREARSVWLNANATPAEVAAALEIGLAGGCLSQSEYAAMRAPLRLGAARMYVDSDDDI